MKEITLKQTIHACQINELATDDRELIEKAIEATRRSYAKYSHFYVGAALRLKNNEVIIGCNQENAAFPVCMCAERSAIFAAGAQYPDQPVMTIAVAARNGGTLLDDPITPCGSCRQALLETEQRFGQQVRILLYGTKHIYIINTIKDLMPLSFTEF